MPDTSEKNITATIAAQPERRQGKKKQTIASLKVYRDPENTEDVINVAFSGDPADQFLTEFEEQATNMGEDPESFQPTISFDGSWSSNDWTNSKGKTITFWTFWAKTWSFV